MRFREGGGQNEVAREADGPLLFASCPFAVVRSVALPRCCTEVTIGPRDNVKVAKTPLVDDVFVGTAFYFWQKGGSLERSSAVERTFDALFSAIGRLLGF